VVLCRNPASGARVERVVELRAGEERTLKERLYQPARLTPSLTRGDAFSVDDAPAGPAAREVEPGRRRVTLYAGGREVDTAYLDVAPGGCRLVDAPRLACENP
jgi:hypothetical protein